MRFLSLLFILIAFSTGCIHDSKLKDDAGLPDELNKKWEDAWNKKDSATVVGMFDKDISMNTGQIYKGIDSMKSWVSHYIPRIANLKTEKVNVVQGEDMIVYTCTLQARGDKEGGCCRYIYRLVQLCLCKGWYGLEDQVYPDAGVSITYNFNTLLCRSNQ